MSRWASTPTQVDIEWRLVLADPDLLLKPTSIGHDRLRTTDAACWLTLEMLLGAEHRVQARQAEGLRAGQDVQVHLRPLLTC